MNTELVRPLRGVRLFVWIRKLVPIPAGLYTARLLSDAVTRATNGDTKGVLTVSLLLILVTACLALFQIASETACERALARARHESKMRLYKRFLACPLPVLYRASHGEAKEKLNDDFQTVTDKIVSLQPGFYAALLTALSYGASIALESPYVAGAILALSLFQLIPPLAVKRFFQVNYDNCRDIEAELTERTAEAYRGFAAIKLYHLKSWYLNRIKDVHDRYAKIGNASIYSFTGQKAMNALIENLLRYGAYGVAGLFVLRTPVSLETGVRAIALSGGLFAAVKTVFAAIPGFGVAKVAEGRLAAWLDAKDEGGASPEGTRVTLEGVTLARGEKPILENATATLDLSRVTLIKGANGAGKSTLLRLIAGVETPDGGIISVGGAVKIDPRAYPRTLFLLPQRDAEFDFPAGELFDMAAPDKAGAACEIARSFGLTDVQLTGAPLRALSGGERKKAYLSLALALDPPLLLLDEPSNALDKESRDLLLRLLRDRAGGALIVTHDPGFNAVADAVCTVGEGGVFLA